MARFRLRFLMQEVDLARGTTTMGRSPQCHVTLEDPLVSREHAQIVIGDDGAYCEDLKSRNGVKLNGVAVRGRTKLSDRDRIRIGTHELVFCEVPDAPAALSGRTTGSLSYCVRCRFPYARELVSCPNCGSTEQRSADEEDTFTGKLDGRAQQSWSVQLLAEVVEKALSLGRTADASRAMLRIVGQLEERANAHDALDPSQLDAAARLAVRVAVVTDDISALAGLLRVSAKSGCLPSEGAVDAMLGLPDSLRGRLAVAVAAALRSLPLAVREPFSARFVGLAPGG